MTSRRQALTALSTCMLVASFGSAAQSPRVYRIGWISLGKADAPSPFIDAFRQGLRERGYVERRDVIIEARFADGSRERADEMVKALVHSKVDVIVTQGGALRSAVSQGGATPVVFGYSGDPVAAKIVESFARPGGTRTGMSFLALELVGKRLEVLAQVLPMGSRVAIVADPEHPGEQAESGPRNPRHRKPACGSVIFRYAAWMSSTRHSGAWPARACRRWSCSPTPSRSTSAKGSRPSA